jgi:hypothetical protein
VLIIRVTALALDPDKGSKWCGIEPRQGAVAVEAVDPVGVVRRSGGDRLGAPFTTSAPMRPPA